MKKLLFIPLLYLCINLLSCTGGYIITERPAVPYYERPLSPGIGYVWIDGDWVWEGGRYMWHEGHWDRPRGNRHWEGGNWVQHGRGYAWHKGHWR